jgi:hypothetical protein
MTVEPLPIPIRGTLAKIGVQGKPGSYFGYALMDVWDKKEEEVGEKGIICIIPSDRIQRVFEVAFPTGMDIKVWGYKISPPAGYEDSPINCYEIVRAEALDLVKLGCTEFW